ncbi:protein kinase [Planomonospora sp. ID91781]|uniref:serine/threonine protein kinase n=1 Tax=Planomonospora sp. ID91781 TaxID=2738135 RepID=UPI0018C3A3D4|nr:serine/threonine protein kinase [Planomonospora sp. ID91781]MBG0822071.1 protein kinase [Planomonospora sp. ID91781]
MSDSQELIADRYRLLEHIGRGGMGTVWRARDEVLGRNVAVKEVIPSPDLTGPEREVFTVRTLREARAAGRIGHPCVATVYDVVEERGRPWIVMQLVDSRTLGAVIREDGPLPPARVARIGLEVLGALVAAHRVGVLHRDVKPDNVLLAADGRAVLTDFGIAMLEGDSSVTRTGALIGTPAFIAPERAGGGPAEFASDLWSLGVTLYMAVEGRSPFQRAHPLATLAAVMHEPPPPLRYAGALGPVISGLLRKDPRLRMSAQEACASLRGIVDGTAPDPTMPIDLTARGRGPATGEPETGPGPAAPAAVPAAPLAGSAAYAGPAAEPLPGGNGPVGAGPAGTPPAPPQAGSPAGQAPPPAAAPASRRRPVMAGVAASVLAVALSAGGMAWVTAQGSAGGAHPAGPSNPTVQASVPAKGRTAPPATDTVGTDSRPTGSGGSRPAARPTGAPAQERGAPREESSGKPSQKPSQKPSRKPSGDSGNGQGTAEKPSEKGRDDGNGRNNGGGNGNGNGQDRGADPPGRDDGEGRENGDGRDGGADPPGQVDPGNGPNAMSANAPGKAVKARKAGKPRSRR